MEEFLERVCDMKLETLLQAIEIVEIVGNPQIEVRGISYHSQKVREGDVFVCIRGYLTDGHKYLKNAVESGAVAAVVESIQEDVLVPQIVVKDSRVALAALGAQYYGHPSNKMKMIGITATNGKTTTSYMVNSILEQMHLRTGLIGTVMIKNHDHHIPAELTTPESLDLQRYLFEMVTNDVSHVTMEVSSSALELNRVHQVDFDIVAFNNLSREHIDAHGSYEAYKKAKTSLIKKAKSGATAILNLDSPESAALINEVQADVVTYGLNETGGNLVCRNLDLSSGRGTFSVEVQESFKGQAGQVEPVTFDVSLAVPGLHSVYNALSAIAIALTAGAPIPAIQEGLKAFKGVERRFEFIHEGDFIIVDDHFANAGNIDVTLKTLDYMRFNRMVMVYAIRGNRGPTVNRENAEMISKWAKKLDLDEIIATKSIHHVTKKDTVTGQEVDVFMEVMTREGIRVILLDDLEEAIQLGLKKVLKGDLLLLAGCQGMDFGGEIALHQLVEMYPDQPKDQLLAPLKHRVCGISDLN